MRTSIALHRVYEVRQCDDPDRRNHVPENLLVSIPPRVNSALPTLFGVRNKLKSDGSPCDTKPAKNPWADADIPMRPYQSAVFRTRSS